MKSNHHRAIKNTNPPSSQPQAKPGHIRSANLRKGRESWRVVPLGVNVRRHWLEDFRAIAQCAGMRFSDFVVCALFESTAAYSRVAGLSFGEAVSLSPSQRAFLGLRTELIKSAISDQITSRNTN